MSDPSAALRLPLINLVKANAGVIAAFAGKPVRVYDIAPTNAIKPYVVVAGFDVTPQPAECLDAVEVEGTFDIWSLTDPPGRAQAEAIGKAIGDIDFTGGLVVPGFRVTSDLPLGSSYPFDPSDGVTVHGIVRRALFIDPV